MTNVGRGLWRLYIGASGLWALVVLVLAFFILIGPPGQHGDFLDNCPDLKPTATNTRPLTEWSDAELTTFVEKGDAATRGCVVRHLGIWSALALVPSAVTLFLGLLVAWIVRGFRGT